MYISSELFEHILNYLEYSYNFCFNIHVYKFEYLYQFHVNFNLLIFCSLYVVFSCFFPCLVIFDWIQTVWMF